MKEFVHVANFTLPMDADVVAPAGDEPNLSTRNHVMGRRQSVTKRGYVVSAIIKSDSLNPVITERESLLTVAPTAHFCRQDKTKCPVDIDRLQGSSFLLASRRPENTVLAGPSWRGSREEV